MKILILLSFLPLFIHAQADTIKLTKIRNYHPAISGYQLGEIPYYLLCDSLGITNDEKSRVLSFELSYVGRNGFTERKIVGHQIPDSICTEIGLYGLRNMIFINRIRAISSETMKIIYLTPMNLTPIKKED